MIKTTGSRASIACVLFLTLGIAYGDDSATPEGVSLEVIMANPDWIGNQPEDAWWSWEGESILYQRKQQGEKIRDLYRVKLDAPTRAEKISDTALADVTTARADDDKMRARMVFARNGDIFVRDLRTGGLRQLTRTAETETDPFFLTDDNLVAWRTGHAYFIHDLATGLTRQAAELKLETDPAQPDKTFNYLREQQLRLFDTLREEKQDQETLREHARKLQEADPSRIPLPYYLGDKVKIVTTSLSPAANYLLVITEPGEYDAGNQDQMPNYVTTSGYVESREVRTLVGLNPSAPQSVILLDLSKHTQTTLDLARLPGSKDDPLQRLRKTALDWHVKKGADREQVSKALEAPAIRPLTVEGIAWSDDGGEVALQLHSTDNKDRWLATIDFADRKFVTQHRLTDPAWINWSFNEFGWLPDSHTLWYLSEESGYSHLYVKPVNSRRRQLTEGGYEVSSPAPDRDSSHIYFIANQQHPGWHDIYRVAVAGGAPERLTVVGIEPEARVPAQPPFALSPDETRILFRDGGTTSPPELYVQLNRPGAEPERVSFTISEQFAALPWVEPEIIEVPSSHVERTIHARLYTPKDYDETKSYPAVVFVHGAGYLQNAHYGWSSYFREFMFHTLLTLHGYVVLDMDYRASEGYGRDWRTAIYRQMGHPELEDLRDGVAWLTRNLSVDPGRVGVYGGSYGGFMTFMAMFRTPELFAAGASLRPVTDWVHYNHVYTSNILNTPLIDPVAHERSSPITWAESYANRPLYIFHGMQDDNVFYKDTVRLVQRLLELHKENYHVMGYPLDPHGFVHADSWLDEYRRIFRLFENNLK